jgi:hypothetical protein
MAKHNGHKTETPDVSHIRNVDCTHETSDININGVLVFVVGLTIMTIAVFFGLSFLFGQFQKQARSEPKPGPMALQQEERLPPEPRLQAAPGFEITLRDGSKENLATREPQAEYKALLDEWNKELNGQLKDASGNPTSMPIEEAIQKVLAGEGLPARTKQAPNKLEDYAISSPTAASSGRISEKRVQ